jgi:hypothetical protein
VERVLRNTLLNHAAKPYLVSIVFGEADPPFAAATAAATTRSGDWGRLRNVKFVAWLHRYSDEECANHLLNIRHALITFLLLDP